MELLIKVGLGIVVSVLIIIGIMVLCLATAALWSHIQEIAYDEWDIKLPPHKSSWYSEWKRTGELTSDVVPIAIMRCSHCDYKTPVMSRCCPSCGRHMDNWDLKWNWREKEG